MKPFDRRRAYQESLRTRNRRGSRFWDDDDDEEKQKDEPMPQTTQPPDVERTQPVFTFQNPPRKTAASLFEGVSETYKPRTNVYNERGGYFLYRRKKVTPASLKPQTPQQPGEPELASTREPPSKEASSLPVSGEKRPMEQSGVKKRPRDYMYDINAEEKGYNRPAQIDMSRRTVVTRPKKISPEELLKAREAEELIKRQELVNRRLGSLSWRNAPAEPTPEPTPEPPELQMEEQPPIVPPPRKPRNRRKMNEAERVKMVIDDKGKEKESPERLEEEPQLLRDEPMPQETHSPDEATSSTMQDAGIDKDASVMDVQKKQEETPIITPAHATTTGPLQDDPEIEETVPMEPEPTEDAPPDPEPEEPAAEEEPGPDPEMAEAPEPEEEEVSFSRPSPPRGEMEAESTAEQPDDYMEQAGELPPEEPSAEEKIQQQRQSREEIAQSFIPQWRDKIARAVETEKFQSVLLKFKGLLGDVQSSKSKMVPPAAVSSEVPQEAQEANAAGTTFVDYVNRELAGRELLEGTNDLESTIDHVISKMEYTLHTQIPELKRAVMEKVAQQHGELTLAIDGDTRQFNDMYKRANDHVKEELDMQLGYVRADLQDETDRIESLENSVDTFKRNFAELQAAFYAAPIHEREREAKRLADAFESMMGVFKGTRPIRMEQGAVADAPGVAAKFHKRDAAIKQMQRESPPTEDDLAGLGSGRQPHPEGGYQGPYDFNDMNLWKEVDVFPYGTLEFWETAYKLDKKGKKMKLSRPKYFVKEKGKPMGDVKEILKKEMPGKRSRGTYIQRYLEQQAKLAEENQRAVDERSKEMLSKFKADKYDEYKKINQLED